MTKGEAREALEFAPGLLAVQDAPPTPRPQVVMYCVVGLFTFLLTWVTFGRLDVVASAEGRLVPETYVKIVQPAEGGIVKEILVREGQRVTAGQVVVRMDEALSEADGRAIRKELRLKKLQLRRIDAELEGVPMAAAPGDPPDLFSQVEAQHKAHAQRFADAVAQEQSGLERAGHDLKAGEELLFRLEQVVPSYERNAAAYEELAASGHASPLAVEERQRLWIEKEQELRSQAAAVAGLGASVAASRKRLEQITSGYSSQLRDERMQTETEVLRLEEAWAKFEHRTGLLELRAPQAGTVKDLATHTQGTVVSPGTVLITLVPDGEPLVAEVLVRNEDVGFVHTGQEAKVKLVAYPFQKYGMLDGRVSHIGPDAESVRPADEQSGEETEGPQFKALLRLRDQELVTENSRFRLSAGMQIVAEMKQGSRSVMEYLLSPVQKAWHEAGRER